MTTVRPGTAGVEGYRFGGSQAAAPEEEVQGFFVGDGTKRLGLKRGVDRETFRTLLDAKRPDGTFYVRNPRSPDRVKSFEVGLSTSKDVGALFAGGPDNIKSKVMRALDAADFGVVLPYLEEKAGFIRTGAGGKTFEKAGLVVASWSHLCARPQDGRDPAVNLHRHWDVFNIGVTKDGRTGALATRQLYQHVKTLEALRTLEVSYQLDLQLGVEIVPTGSTFKIGGVPKSLVDELSERSKAIRERLEVVGGQSFRAKQYAAFETRGKKEGIRSMPELFEAWRQKCENHGFHVGMVIDRPAKDRDLTVEFRRALEQGIAAAAAKRTTFTEDKLLQHVCKAAIGRGLSAKYVRGVVSSTLRYSKDIVRLKDEKGRDVFTTKALQKSEKKLLDQSRYLHLISRHGVKERDVIRAVTLGRGKRLMSGFTAEDVRGVKALTAKGHSNLRIVLTGEKFDATKIVQKSAELWRAKGYEVIHVGRDHSRAKKFGDETGVRAQSVQAIERMVRPGVVSRLKHDARMIGRAALGKQTWRMHEVPSGRKTVFVVTDAHKLSIDELKALTKVAGRSGALLAMVGEAANTKTRNRSFDKIVRMNGAVQLHQEDAEKAETRRPQSIERSRETGR